MNDEKKILSIAIQRLNDNRARNDKFAALDDMKHVRWAATWEAGNQKPSWWQDKPSAQPKNDLSAATRMYSTVAPVLKMTPLRDSADAKAHCNDVEDAAMWQYQLAATRGDGAFTYSIVESIMNFGMGAAQVIYLPWQRKITAKLGVAASWDVQGDYGFVAHHPSTIYDQTSNIYGLQNVLCVQDVYGDDILAAWGDGGKDSEATTSKIKEIMKEAEESGHRPIFRTYDWTDDKHRVFMAQELGAVEMGNAADVEPSNTESIMIYSGEHKLPFMSWAIKRVGSELEKKPEYKATGLFDAMYEGDQWNQINIWRSTVRASTAATLFAPQNRSETRTGESPEIDNSIPGGVVAQEIGEKFEKLPPPQLDPRIMQLIQEDEAEIGEGTLPRIIANPQPMNGTAFATQNQMIDAANSSLLRFTRKSEEILEDVFKIMLKYKIHTGDSLDGYAMERDGKGAAKGYSGRPISIKSGAIPRKMQDISDIASPYAIYLKVKLTNALPIDEVQKLNGANIQRNLGLPDEMVYEEIGYTNPHQIVEDRYRQIFVEAAMSEALEKLKANAQAAATRIMNDVQLEFEKARMALAPPQPGQGPPPSDTALPEEGGGMPPDVAGGAMSQVVQDQLNPDQMRQQAYAKAAGGSEGADNELSALMAAAQGGNFATNAGGASISSLAPESLTREGITGRDKRGKQVRKAR